MDKDSQPAPHGLFDTYLGSQSVEDLLSYVIEHEGQFRPSTVGAKDSLRVDTGFRTSLGISRFGPLEALFRDKILKDLPTMSATLGVPTFEPTHVELDLTVYGDGAFYERHIDTVVARAVMPSTTRVISAVYYFHPLPKIFTGGSLRLFSFFAAGGNPGYTDIEPIRDRLVFFPSWAPHEVQPVRCPSKVFTDARFSINCWFHRAAR